MYVTAAQFAVVLQASIQAGKVLADVEPNDPGLVSKPHKICQLFLAVSTKDVKLEVGHKLVETATAVDKVDDADNADDADDAEVTTVARVDATLL